MEVEERNESVPSPQSSAPRHRGPRVLMISWEFRPNVVGGLGKAVTELVPELLAEGAEVHLVTPLVGKGDVTERIEGKDGRGTLVVYRVPPPVSDVLDDIYTLAEETNLALEAKAREVVESVGNIEIIHAHDWLVASSAIATKHAFKLPLVTTIHATEYGRHRGHIYTDMSRAIHNLEWWLTYESWRIIVCSRFMSSEIGVAFRAPVDKMDVIPNGVDATPFDDLEGADLTAFRRQFAEPDEKIIFQVGRVVYEKGGDISMEAMLKVLAQRPKTKLILTGDGPHLPALREKAASLNLGDRVIFTGFVSIADRNRLYRLADVAIFPSLYEPFGIVALEAIAAKAPVVVSNVGGLPEVVTHNETGLLVYPGDPDSLAWGILETLDHPEWAKMRTDNAYRMAKTDFNWRTLARQTIEVYNRVIEARAQVGW